MSNIQDSQIVDAIVKLLVPKRPSPQLKRFKNDEGELIKIPFQSGNKKAVDIAVFIQKAEKELPENPIVLFTHGDGESIKPYLEYAQYFCPYGISFCAMDYRGSGYSGGLYNTSGVNETADVITVINYLKSRGFNKISFFGRSLGALCGIYIAAKYPDLVCLALDSGPINLKDLTIYQLNSFKKIDKEKVEQLYPEACRIIKEKHGIDFLAFEEPDAVAEKVTQPIFVIHGTKDIIVPIENSEKLMELVKSQDKKFVSFDFGHNDLERFNFFIDQFVFILNHNGVDVQRSEIYKDE